MKITKRQLYEGERIPFGYGLAFWDFALAMGVFYPIPINVFIRLVRLVYFAFMRGLIPDMYHAKVIEARVQIQRQARGLGHKEGWDACMKHWDKVFLERLSNIRGDNSR